MVPRSTPGLLSLSCLPFFSTKPRDKLGRMYQKWFIWCRVGHKNLISVNQVCFLLLLVRFVCGLIGLWDIFFLWQTGWVWFLCGFHVRFVAYFCWLLLFVFLPSVLWHCWLGGRKGIRPLKNWAVGCWCGYLSGARCSLAYGPADATATHCLLLQ